MRTARGTRRPAAEQRVVRALAAFVKLSRPLFLYGGFAGVALGAAVAAWSGRRLDLGTYLWAQGMVTAFHLMVHYANDYFDRDGDRIAERTRWSGGSGVLASGALPPKVALYAALCCAGLGLAGAARFAAAGNVAAAGLGAAILGFAWCYSAPPIRLAARGLGELDTVLVVALLVPAVGYTAFSGAVDGQLTWALLAPAAAMFTMMLCVELPDADADSIAGKRTLVVRMGASLSWTLIAGIGAAAAIVAAGVALRVRGAAGILVILPALVAGFELVRLTRGDRRPASLAFWGVALYAATATGLALSYGLAAAAR